MHATVISRVRIAAAHDGSAELVVTLRHGNAGESDVTLDSLAAATLLDACGGREVGDLVGQSWERVREALNVSWNRYSGAPPPARRESGG